MKNIINKFNLHKNKRESLSSVSDRTQKGLFWLFDDGKQERKINEYGLEEKYVKDCLDKLFNGEIPAGGGFLYSRSKDEKSGSKSFDVVEECSLYKENITQKEELIYTNDSFISKNWPYFLNRHIRNIIELGSGSGEKFPKYFHKGLSYFNLIESKNFKKEDKKYYAIDISAKSIEDTKSNYEKYSFNLSNGVVGDFTAGGELPWNLKNQGFVFLGGTIGNFTIKEIQTILKRALPNTWDSTVPIIMTYFSAADKKKLEQEDYQNRELKLKATYGDPNTNNPYYNQEMYEAINSFIMGGFESLGFPIDKLELKVEYEHLETMPSRIKVGVEITKDFEMKKGDMIYKGKKGYKLRAIQSQRFTQNNWKDILGETGFVIKENIEKDGVASMVVQSKLGINTKFKKIRRGIIYGAIISGLILSGGIFTKNIIEKKEKDKIFTQKEKIWRQKDQRFESLYNNDSIWRDSIQKTLLNLNPGQNIPEEEIDVRCRLLYETLEDSISFQSDFLSSSLVNDFVSLYGKGNFSKEHIKEQIALYLSSSKGIIWLERIKKDTENKDTIKAFLNDFVEKYFFTQMIDNGYSSINPKNNI